MHQIIFQVGLSSEDQSPAMSRHRGVKSLAEFESQHIFLPFRVYKILTQFKIPYNSHFTMYLTPYAYGVAIISKIKKEK